MKTNDEELRVVALYKSPKIPLKAENLNLLLDTATNVIISSDL